MYKVLFLVLCFVGITDGLKCSEKKIGERYFILDCKSSKFNKPIYEFVLC